MKRSVIVLISAVALSGLSSLAMAQKIGVVDTARLMQEAPQARTAMETLNTEFASREREVTTLDANLKAAEERLRRDAATMTEVQRAAVEKEIRDGSRDLQLKYGELQDDFGARRNEELQKLNRMLLEEVQAFARANGYDLVLAEGILFASAAMDVTGPVLEALKTRGNRPAAATPARP